MKRLFISQPMNGKTNEEIIATREKAVEKAKYILGCEVEVIDSIIDSFFANAFIGTDKKPLWFLGSSIQSLSKADVAIFCNGWQNARGCKIEHECAVEYDIKIIE